MNAKSNKISIQHSSRKSRALLAEETEDKGFYSTGQASAGCEHSCMPPECQETWSLCKEFLLCESERALMKLLWELQRDNLQRDNTLQKVGCITATPLC